MPPEESHYPRDWLRIAEKDWRRVDQALDDSDPEGAGFWLQQAVEKYLKAYLLSKGWGLRKVHDLEVLVNEATTIGEKSDNMPRSAEKSAVTTSRNVTRWWIPSRSLGKMFLILGTR